MTEYAVTDVVPQTGEYLCTACGETTEFEAADDFAVCGSCGDENAGWTPVVDEGGETKEQPSEEDVTE